jgi:hypothetical protein
MRACLDGGQDDASVRMLELGNDTLAYMLAFSFINGLVSRQSVQNCNPSPFRTLVQGDKEFLNGGGIEGKETFFRPRSDRCKMDVRKSGNCVRDDLRGGS